MYPGKRIVEILKERFPEGTRVELIRMSDPFSRLVKGDRGTVRDIDDIGTIFVDWDCGSGLGVAYGEDLIKKVEVE